MKYPINYDFGKNWETKIKPFLDHPLIKKAIRKGVNDYLSNFPTKKRYKKNTPPADYSSKDAYAMIMDRKRKNLFKKLKESNKISKEYLEFKKKLSDNADSSDEDDWIILFEMKEEILDPYFTWDKIKYDLE